MDIVSYRLLGSDMMKNDELGEFFTPQQIARKLQLNVLTVYSYIRYKRLPAIKFGRNYRISEKDLNRFLRINRTSG